MSLEQYLPENGEITARAEKEMRGFGNEPAMMTLVQTFGRRCIDKHKPREDEPIPVSKGKSLRATRTTFEGCEYRLIYVLVREDPKPGGAAARAESSTRTTGRFVGLMSLNKKKRRLGPDAKKAWARSEAWLTENPNFKRL